MMQQHQFDSERKMREQIGDMLTALREARDALRPDASVLRRANAIRAVENAIRRAEQ